MITLVTIAPDGAVLPAYQSSEALRALIASGHDTAACFAELKRRNTRLRTLASMFGWSEAERAEITNAIPFIPVTVQPPCDSEGAA